MNSPAKLKKKRLFCTELIPGRRRDGHRGLCVQLHRRPLRSGGRRRRVVGRPWDGTVHLLSLFCSITASVFSSTTWLGFALHSHSTWAVFVKCKGGSKNDRMLETKLWSKQEGNFPFTRVVNYMHMVQNESFDTFLVTSKLYDAHKGSKQEERSLASIIHIFSHVHMARVTWHILNCMAVGSHMLHVTSECQIFPQRVAPFSVTLYQDWTRVKHLI